MKELLNEHEQEIEARERAAAVGPWDAAEYGDINGQSSECYIHGPKVVPLPDTVAYEWDDADFIAHAREDIPYLLAQLKEARGKLEAVEEQIVYGFTGETLENMTVKPLTDQEMNKWWINTIARILQPQKEGE